MFYCLKISQNIFFWKSFQMNKYTNVNPLLIHKEKEQTMRTNYVVVLSM